MKPMHHAISTPGRPDELRAMLVRQIISYMGQSEDRATAIPRLSIHRRISATEPCSMTYEPGIIVVAQGRKCIELGPNTFVYDESHFLFTAVDVPIRSRVVEASPKVPCLALAFRLDMPVVRELLSHEEIRIPPFPADGLAVAVSETTPELLGAFCRFIDLLNTPEDIPILAGLLEREIIYRVLRGPAGARLRAIATLGDQSQRTAKAIAWIKSNYAQPLRVETLAELAGMGVSTFHHHFRALTAMSPLQYQKQLRLQTARARMLLDGLDAATAAFEVGYESASQFNREYSRFFGQPPMRDIRTLRSPDAPLLEPITGR